MTTSERWYGSLLWIDSSGGEHRWSQWHTDHTHLLTAVAGYFDLISALAEVMEEDLTPPEAGATVVRHVWATVVTHQEADGIEHTSRGWAVSGQEAWGDVLSGYSRLLDLRELLRHRRPAREWPPEVPTTPYGDALRLPYTPEA